MNAHSAISRTAVRHRLHALATSPDADPLDTLALLFFDLFYSLPTRCLLVTERPHDILIALLQYRGLNQGCGMAGYYYNATASHLIALALRPFPLTSCTSIHDDGTLDGPVAVLTAELLAHTPASGAPHQPFQPSPVHPTSAKDPNLTPYLANSLTAVAHTLSTIADLEIELSKTHLLHLSSPSQPSLATIMLPTFPEGTTIQPSHCVVGGAPFGSDEGIRAYLRSLTATYTSLLTRLASVRDLDRHGGTLMLLICLKPCVKFNHHLRVIPPSLSAEVAAPLRDACISALASILAVDPALLLRPPPSTRTLEQILTPALGGGLGVVDPATVGPAAFLASLADTIPALLTDPHLAQLLTRTDLWADSHSRSLRDAHHTLATFANMPQLYSMLPHDLDALDQPSALSSLIDQTTGRPTLARLHLAAQGHLQTPLLRILHQYIATARPPVGPEPAVFAPGPATDGILAAARFTQAAAFGASALLTAHDLPTHIAIPPVAFTAWILHRVGVPWPDIPLDRLRRCAPSCKGVTAALPLDRNPKLLYTLPLALHHLSCPSYGLRIKKHDLYLRTLAHGVSRIIGPHTRCACERTLAADDATRKQIDALISDDHGPHHTLTLDAWLVNELLPSYLHRAASGAHPLALALAYVKHSKHAAGCLRLNRPFLSVIVNTMGGIGPATTSPSTPGPPAEPTLTCVRWIRRSFADAVARERERGGTGAEAHRAAAHLLQHLNSILAKQHHSAVTRLTRETT